MEEAGEGDGDVDGVPYSEDDDIDGMPFEG